MPFLKQAWYCSGWSHEISGAPISRTILGEPIVFFRKMDGSVIALSDTCPHRFAPLHLGEVHGDAIQCPYHGLQFGEAGLCTLNPHDERIPASLKVTAYPVVERHRAIWLWMGDPAAANPALIPDCCHHDDPNFKTIFDLVPVAGHYELVSDNLLDLTHVRFLHKSFQAPSVKAYEAELIEDGRSITSVYNIMDAEKSDFISLMWPEAPARVDIYASNCWQAPANLLQRNCNTGAGWPEEQGILAFTSHLITPETETTSHYFWSYSRNWRRDDDEFEQILHQGLDHVIRNDDATMIGHIQRKMGPTGDLRSLRPVILPTDNAAMRARYVLAQMIKAENAAADA